MKSKIILLILAPILFLPVIKSIPLVKAQQATFEEEVESQKNIAKELYKILFDFSLPPPIEEPNLEGGSGAPPGAEEGESPGAFSGSCSSAEALNQIYGATPAGACWADARKAVEASLTKITLLGYSIRVHSKAVASFQAVEEELKKYKKSDRLYHFAQGDYPIYSVQPGNFRCIKRGGRSKSLCDPDCSVSLHSFGIAVDINPATNQQGSTEYDMPPEIIAAFEGKGFRWGGRFTTLIDAMHFEYLGESCR